MIDKSYIIKTQSEILCDFLPKGEENAITPEELAKRIGLNPWQSLKVVQAAQMTGFSIAETEKGIFIPETKEEEEMSVYFAAARIFREIEALNPTYEKLTGERLVLTREGVEND